MSQDPIFVRYNRPISVEGSKGVPNGVVIAMRNDEGVVKFGWSACVEGDVFDKQIALDIAIARAKKGNDRPVPSSISHVVSHTTFLKDCSNYFKEELQVIAFIERDGKKCPVLFKNVGQEVPIGVNVDYPVRKQEVDEDNNESLKDLVEEYAQRVVEGEELEVLMNAHKDLIIERLSGYTPAEIVGEIHDSCYSNVLDKYKEEALAALD